MMIRLLTPSDIDSFTEHVARHLAESGRGGTPIFWPQSSSEPWDRVSKRKAFLERWSKGLHEPSWNRAWAAYDGDRMVGHLDLGARPLATSLHRAILGMGIEESHRKQGLGQRLIETAIEWAKKQPSLDWLDLNVFAHNEPAKRLYEKCGFKEVGRMSDLFRVDGQSIDDIQMVLRLR
jgi:RimJ/RimL family protein N-acetyltransferase